MTSNNRQRVVVATSLEGKRGREFMHAGNAEGEARPMRELFRPNAGRDELNLAEFPITLLSDRVPKGCKTLVFEDKVFDQQNGELVSRKVTVTGSDAYGLPTAVDDEILVAYSSSPSLMALETPGCSSPATRFCEFSAGRMLGRTMCELKKR